MDTGSARQLQEEWAGLITRDWPFDGIERSYDNEMSVGMVLRREMEAYIPDEVEDTGAVNTDDGPTVLVIAGDRLGVFVPSFIADLRPQVDIRWIPLDPATATVMIRSALDTDLGQMSRTSAWTFDFGSGGQVVIRVPTTASHISDATTAGRLCKAIGAKVGYDKPAESRPGLKSPV